MHGLIAGLCLFLVTFDVRKYDTTRFTSLWKVSPELLSKNTRMVHMTVAKLVTNVLQNRMSISEVKFGGAKHTSLFSCLYPFPSDDVSPNVVILYC